MPIVFQAEPEPSADLLEEVAALAPENPFYTPAYATAMRMAGEQPWMMALRDGGEWLTACTGFLRRGRISCRIGIRSLPALGAHAPLFWDELLRFCRRAGVTDLETNTYASVESQIPASPTPTRRTDRTEYVIDLEKDDPWQAVHQGHRRRINRARKAGVQRRCSTSESDGRIHVQMMASSMRRRQGRGEPVSTDIGDEEPLALLRAGAGVLSQAVFEGRVLSSVLVLLSGRGAYYHSAGTDAEGMELGASQFVILETARDLRGRGFAVFNLGGASPETSGLHEFKSRFGAIPHPLAAAEFDLQNGFRKGLRAAFRGARDRLASMLER
jgi:hypothetical protein